MSEQPATARPGDIVQIVDRTHPWFPALLVVGEVRSWGVQACAYLPESNQPGSMALQGWNRLTSGTFAVVGHAQIVPFADVER